MRLPTFLSRSSLLLPWGDSSITSVRSRPQRALPPDGTCSPIFHSKKPSIRYTSPSTATRQSLSSLPSWRASSSDVNERSPLAAPPSPLPSLADPLTCQYTAPPIMAKPRITLTSVVVTTFFLTRRSHPRTHNYYRNRRRSRTRYCSCTRYRSRNHYRSYHRNRSYPRSHRSHSKSPPDRSLFRSSRTFWVPLARLPSRTRFPGEALLFLPAQG